MINIDFKSIADIIKVFPDESVCIAHLEKLRWNGIITSPFDPTSKVYECKNKRYRCRNTGKYFNVRTGTVFSNSRIELQKWFMAIWIVTTSKKGISSTELSKDLNLTQKTAWYMIRRIKNYFGANYSENLHAKTKNKFISPKKIKAIEVTAEKDKFEMVEWLQLLKKNK